MWSRSANGRTSFVLSFMMRCGFFQLHFYGTLKHSPINPCFNGSAPVTTATLLESFPYSSRFPFDGFKTRDRLDDLICGYNGTGVVWNIDVESGAHPFFRQIRDCVFYHRDLVAKFGGKADSCLHACACDESDDNE